MGLRIKITDHKMSMIQVENLTRMFGSKRAVDNISFDVREGEILGFLGPNGAGKTTTMRILSCFIPATGGKVRIDGLDVFGDSLEVRRKIGYLPENVPLYPDMRVNEYLGYRCSLKGLSGRKRRRRMTEVLEMCSLTEVRKTIIGKLSKGYRQRVGLADALVHEPQVLILDEPTIGLDPNQIRHIRNLIKSLAGKHTVILSSHILPEVEMVCERVLIMKNGKIVASDTPGNLVGLMKGNMHVMAEIMAPEDLVRKSIESLAGVVRLTLTPNAGWMQVTCECAKGVDIREDIFRLVRANDWVLRELRVEKKHLEDVFIEVTAEDSVLPEEKVS